MEGEGKTEVLVCRVQRSPRDVYIVYIVYIKAVPQFAGNCLCQPASVILLSSKPVSDNADKSYMKLLILTIITDSD